MEPGLYLLRLANGPTLAFKDLALQFLGNLFEYLLSRSQGRLNVLGATSGDTGSAAEYALRGKRRIAVFMLSPAGSMSPFQRAQMYTLLCMKYEDCPRFTQFQGHNHVSDIMSINSADSVVGEATLDFIRDVLEGSAAGAQMSAL